LLAILALAPSLVVLCRQTFGRRRAVREAAQHAVAVTGAAGMSWSLLILFAFQTRAGALYGQLGLLTALFMVGLAAGAGAMRGAAVGAERRNAAQARNSLLVVCGLALLYAAALPLALPAVGRLAEQGPLAAVAGHGVLLFLAGLVTGGLFPAGVGALLAAGSSATDAAGRIETADHYGAALAALVSAVLFIPLFGLVATAWLVAALEATVFAAVLLVRAK
jgi:spermidine synthase